MNADLYAPDITCWRCFFVPRYAPKDGRFVVYCAHCDISASGKTLDKAQEAFLARLGRKRK